MDIRKMNQLQRRELPSGWEQNQAMALPTHS